MTDTSSNLPRLSNMLDKSLSEANRTATLMKGLVRRKGKTGLEETDFGLTDVSPDLTDEGVSLKTMTNDAKELLDGFAGDHESVFLPEGKKLEASLKDFVGGTSQKMTVVKRGGGKKLILDELEWASVDNACKRFKEETGYDTTSILRISEIRGQEDL